ncbi:LytR/AlgR family response regulator transcription factor [Pontibacter virosus]|uniref:LytTR family two component transcriptional regulator n=1 Tax=Pontibacter virosus TaxID=1765052 RepID=A0A2U1AWV9_9BACT|nr:LytTR family DNA-binding domain-containing protein [Pontibacter virosus]PVY40900.1 LytTR family two component transcriptional regulator [Pontibacter virosus]
MITAYIVDDEAHAIQILTRYVEQTPGLSLVGATDNPLQALQLISSGQVRPQLVFVDVDMPLLSGIELADFLSPYASIVFTTAYEEFALQAFDRNAVDYLLKPITYERFLKTVQRIQTNTLVGAAQQEDYFFIKSDVKGRIMRLDLQDVLYVEALQNYIRIHTMHEKHITYLTMKEMEAYLPQERFLRVQKSFIVNTSRVKAVEGHQLILDNDDVLPLGANYRAAFLEKVNARLWKSKRLP